VEGQFLKEGGEFWTRRREGTSGRPPRLWRPEKIFDEKRAGRESFPQEGREASQEKKKGQVVEVFGHEKGGCR